jgi:hypothetical protein
MKSIFHRIVVASAVMVAAAVATTSARAEALIKVPFSFTINGKAFPAGLYAVRHDDRGNFVTLAAKGSEQSFSTILVPGEPDLTDRKIALNFDVVGETHFLRTIQYGPMTTSVLDKKAVQSERASLQRSGGL